MNWYKYITDLQTRIDKDCDGLRCHTNGLSFACAKGNPFYTTMFYQVSVPGKLIVTGDTGCAVYDIGTHPWAWYKDVQADYLSRKCSASETGRGSKQWYCEKYRDIARSCFGGEFDVEQLERMIASIRSINDAEEFYETCYDFGEIDYDGLSIDNGYAPSVECMYHATILRRIGLHQESPENSV